MFTRKTAQTSVLPESVKYPSYIEVFAALVFKCNNCWIIQIKIKNVKINRRELCYFTPVSWEFWATPLFVLSHHLYAHSMASKIFQPLLASNWYWFRRLLLMCLVPKRILTVPLSSSSPQEKTVFITSEQMAVLSNFLRLKWGVWVSSSFLPEMWWYVLSSPLFQFNALIYEVWWVVVNTPYARGVKQHRNPLRTRP